VILRIDRVSKCYTRAGAVRLALEGVSLELDRGQVMGIFGPTGAGKTTLLRIAAGLEAPDSGSVSYGGERIDEMSASQRRRHRRRDIGCVWASQPWTPGLSVAEHVELPLLIDGRERRAAQRTARKFLLACEAEQCATMAPEDLSDGECQRVAIARALVIEPRLLLLDGTLYGLSIVEQEKIMALLGSLARDAKVAVLIADTGAAEMLRADPIFYLREGRLLNTDTADQTGKLYKLPNAITRRFAADA
jgi:putative ABC transport system ATP-binding protein